MPSRKRLILYDLDGTLVDTSEDIAQAVNYMLAQLGRPPLPRQSIMRFVGRGVEQLIRECLTTHDTGMIERGMCVYRTHYAEHLLDHSVLYPGAQAVLDYFKDRAQAVITNKPDPFSSDILAGLGVAGYFLDVIAGNSTYPRKPDPAGIHSLMQTHGVSPAQTLFIGDSAVDVATGRNAGVETAVVSHGFADAEEIAGASPDVVVAHFEEFLTVAKQRGW